MTLPAKRGRMKVGIVEIAARAGVSEATVSRVINRRQGVATKTRDAVEKAMAELGYERPVEGQLVTVITEHVSNPFFADVAERIEAALAPHGLKAVLCPAFPGGVQEREFIASIIDKGIAAVVFLSSSNTVEGADTETYEMLRSRRIPYVGVNGGSPTTFPRPSSPPTTRWQPNWPWTISTVSATAPSAWHPGRPATTRPTGVCRASSTPWPNGAARTPNAG